MVIASNFEMDLRYYMNLLLARSCAQLPRVVRVLDLDHVVFQIMSRDVACRHAVVSELLVGDFSVFSKIFMSIEIHCRCLAYILNLREIFR